MDGLRRRRATRFVRVAAVLTLAVAASACGSSVGRRQLQAANNGVLGARAAGDGVGTPSVEAAAATAGGSTGAGDEVAVSGGTAEAGGQASASGATRASGATGGPKASSGGRKSEIALGVIGTATGPIGAQLADVPVAVRAWVADVNARGGLNGHPVRVVIGDDGGDPAKAAALARRMIDQDHIFAFYGLFGATTEQAMAPIVEQQKIPVVGGVQAPIADTSPMFFNPESGSEGTYRGLLMSLTTQSQARKVAIIYCRESDSCTKGSDIVSRYASKVGVQIVYKTQASLAQPDYTAEVIQARSSGADALLAVIDYASAVRVIKAAHRQNWHPVFLQSASAYTPGYVSGGGADVDGTLALASVVPYGLSPLMQGYRDAVARYVPGGAMGDFGAAVWVAGKMWERLAPSLGDTPTRQAVLDALYAFRGETLGGLSAPLTFGPGAHGEVNLCTVPIRLEGTRWVNPTNDRYVCAP